MIKLLLLCNFALNRAKTRVFVYKRIESFYEKEHRQKGSAGSQARDQEQTQDRPEKGKVRLERSFPLINPQLSKTLAT
jgi:hypothetical protein